MRANEQRLDSCRAAMKWSADMTSILVMAAEQLCRLQAHLVRDACLAAQAAWQAQVRDRTPGRFAGRRSPD